MTIPGRDESRVPRVRSLPIAITGKQPSISTPPISDPLHPPSCHAAHSGPTADPDPPSRLAADPVDSPSFHAAYSSSSDDPVDSPSCHATYSSPAADPVDSTSSVPGPHRDKDGRITFDISSKRQFLCFSSTIFILKRCIGELLQSRQLEFYPTYQDVPQEVKDSWWEEFKILFAWPGYPDEIVRGVFNRAAEQGYLKNMDNIMNLVWQAGKPKPDFLTNEAWAKWIVNWEDLRSIEERSELGKRKRASSCDLGTKRMKGSTDRCEHHRHVEKYEALSEGQPPKGDEILGFGAHDAALLKMASARTSSYSRMDQEGRERAKDELIGRLTQRVDAQEELLQQMGEELLLQREQIREQTKERLLDKIEMMKMMSEDRKTMYERMMFMQQQQMQMLFALNQQVNPMPQVQQVNPMPQVHQQHVHQQ